MCLFPKKQNIRLIVSCVALLLFLPAGSLPATILLKLSVEKMTVESDAIIMGEVTEVKSQWNAQQTTLYTYTTIKVSRCIDGSCTDKMHLKHRGGSAGGKTLHIPGMPQFTCGQKVLLFLRKDPEGQQGFYAVFGMCQGMFVISKDKKSGKVYAVQQHGASIAQIGAGGVIKTDDDFRPLKIPLKKMIKKIKKTIKEHSTGEGKK